MFPPIFRLPRLALPMLSALMLLSLPNAPSQAQAPATLAAKRTQVTQTITPAAVVVSTANYQTMLSLNCSGSTCIGTLPTVANKRRLSLTRLSCTMRSSEYGVYASGQIDLNGLEGPISVVQFLPADYTTSWGWHVFNRAIDVQIAAKQYVKIFLTLATGQAHLASCTAHGTMEVLE
jgi:hypothetical protein